MDGLRPTQAGWRPRRLHLLMCTLVLSFLLLVTSSTCVQRGMGTDIGTDGGAHIAMETSSCSTLFSNTHSVQGWNVVPEECEHLVAQYMNDGQYDADNEGVAAAVYESLRSIAPHEDGMDVVIFDIDETALSNLPYYQQHRYGAEFFDHPRFSKWVEEGKAPAIPSMLNLYSALRAEKWGIVFMTGRTENQRNITAENLSAVGYGSWTTLILRSPSEAHMPAVVYKSKKRLELQEQGYRIWSSLGDQWSDLVGPAVGAHGFKLPNPMYFIP